MQRSRSWGSAQWALLQRHGLDVPAAIGGFFACLYLLTAQGRVNTYDGQSMFATTRALGDHLSLALAQPSLGVRGRDGLSFSKYGIGQSLAELPLYLIGKVLGLASHTKSAQIAQLFAMLTNPLLMALCLPLFYSCARLLGFTRRTAIIATFVMGIATSFWPYSKSDFSEPLLTASLLTAALCVLWSARHPGDPRRVAWLDLLAGVALAVGVLAKYAALAFVPAFCLYLVLAMPRGRPWGLTLRRLALVLAPVILAGCVVLLVNDLRFGSPLRTGYAPDDRPFSGSLSRGLWGVFLSPYRGLLFYDPLLFAGLLCLPLLVWRRPLEAILPLGITLMSILLYATYGPWDAGPAWGPRYLVPMMPFLLWPLMDVGCFGGYEAPRLTLLQRVARKSVVARRIVLAAAGITVAVSAAIQFVGVCMNYYVHDFYWQNGTTAARIIALKSSVTASPLVTALWTLPFNIRYALTGHFPASGFASANFPFGPPMPTGSGMPAALGAFFAQSFWFTLFPHPAVLAGIATVILGLGMVLSLRLLWSAQALAGPTSSDLRPMPGLASDPAGLRTMPTH